jgi:DEAD/DEAH box helicase domain-containing protein
LTWLGEIGILPNYDLPDDAVKLITTVRMPFDVALGERPRPKVQEFVRGGASALRDFAPGNHFYASARRFDVDQLDVGSANRELVELWRFCPDCHHLQLEDATGSLPRMCPQCKHPGWQDAGQVRKLVRLKKVFSRIEDADSRFHDLSETRMQTAMVVRTYFGIESVSQHAVYAERLGFGWEYFSKVRLREVNFGKTGGNAELSTAGDTVSSFPFRVCTKCGVSADSDEGLKMEHRRHCPLHGKPLNESSELMGTYREAYTEAIRFLLPMALHDMEAKRATLEAAFKLGLRKVLGGRVDHLQLSVMVEPAADKDTPMHQYLVMYDSVTGGTGYLEEFASDRTRIQAVLDAAYRALTQCVCGRVAGADGCYQCLFQYRNQREQGRLSRTLGIDQLRQLSSGLPALMSVDGLSGVTVHPQIFESELERLFLEALHARAGVGSQREMIGQAAVGRVVFGAHTWEIKVQQDVGRDWDAIDVASRPDVTLMHVAGPVSRRTVHVFCDGYKYHVGDKPEDNRVPDDIAKRGAILRSGDAFVSTIVWDDLVDRGRPLLVSDEDGKPLSQKVPTWLGGPAAESSAKSLLSFLPHGHVEWLSQSGMDLLVSVLGAASDVDVEETAKLALASLIGSSASSVPDDRAPLVCEPALEYRVRKQPAEWGISASVAVRGQFALGGALAVLQMTDVYGEAQNIHSFQRSWKEWWTMVNLLGPSGVLEVRGE